MYVLLAYVPVKLRELKRQQKGSGVTHCLFYNKKLVITKAIIANPKTKKHNAYCPYIYWYKYHQRHSDTRPENH